MIRFAKPEDIRQINDIYNQAVDSRVSTADLEHITIAERIDWFKEHSESQYPVFVYEIDGTVAGWLSVSPYRKGRRALSAAAEVSYYVHKNYQRMGIGKSLLKNCLEIIESFGIKHIICILLEVNNPSIQLLKSFGFECWGRMPDIADLDGNICSHLYYGLSV